MQGLARWLSDAGVPRRRMVGTQQPLNQPRRRTERGFPVVRPAFTLLELIIVLVVLAALAGIVIPLVTTTSDQARETATQASLAELRDVITQYYQDMDKKLPRPDDPSATSRVDSAQLVYLFVNPATFEDNDSATSDTLNTWDPRFSLGWRGPYVLERTGGYEVDTAQGNQFTTQYGKNGDPCLLDAWQRPIVVQHPVVGPPHQVRLVSAGRNGYLETDPDTPTELLAESDDLILTFELN